MVISKYFRNPPCSSTSPTHEVDLNAADAPLTTMNTSDRLEKLIAEILKMNDTLQNVATDVSSIKQTTVKLNNTAMAMQERPGEAEVRIAHLEAVACTDFLKDRGERKKSTHIRRPHHCRGHFSMRFGSQGLGLGLGESHQ